MSILLRSLSLLVGTTLAAPASGNCLSAKEAKTGVLLTREAPFYSVFYKPDGPGLTEQRLMERNRSLHPVSAVYLHPLLVEKRVSPSGTHELKYANAVALDDLPQKKNWHSETILFINGQRSVSGATFIRFDGWGEETIASCSYKVWAINSRLELTGLPPIIFEQYYSPELRLVLRSVRLGRSNQPLSEVRFDRFQIGWGN
ncbi:hypothetical protein [Rhizobium leguminosarum]|uniref:hypothetical protein n=1 Tax=Rhizobium leguminosarum TaxID=384 RepID=UPI001A93774F|nr:hypothetical protein [Rhizobium leguminosarum]MBY5554171.1 hypothetical protein [Rhizobium leguminosarum]MBY5728569.1 hypothetical protein [Rhizobium leguminosarum]QSW27290.1 hypothetical protein J0664_31185 [Rhizobium leguminosarum]